MAANLNIVICGAGQVGSHAAEKLGRAGHNITVVDRNPARVAAIEEAMDVRTLLGNCASAESLREAGADRADLVIAATNIDEINVLSASIAKGIGAAKTVARVHHSTYFENRGLNYREHFGIDQLICPEYSTAMAIAQTLRNPGAMAIENFARGQIEMHEFIVTADAPGVGKPLSLVGLPSGSRLAAIKRGADAFVPSATSVVQPGDSIILVGNTAAFHQARKLFHGVRTGRRKIVVMGGASIAVWLCRALRDRDFSIRLFETDRERAEELAEKIDWVTVIRANPIDETVFAEEHLSDADAFVALLDDDEHNILGSAWAKSRGVKEAVAVVQRPNYLALLTSIGIDRPFSPRVVAVREIENLLNEGPLRMMSSLAEGFVDVFWAAVGPRAEVAGKPLRELRLSPDWVVVAMARENAVHVPGPDDRLLPGDNVLVVGRHGAKKKLLRLFGLG